MTRKIIFIIVGALLFLLLLGILWFWLLHRGSNTAEQPGSFATSTDKTGGTAAGAQDNGDAYQVTGDAAAGYDVAGVGSPQDGVYQIRSGQTSLGTFVIKKGASGRYNITPQNVGTGPLTSGTYTFVPLSTGALQPPVVIPQEGGAPIDTGAGTSTEPNNQDTEVGTATTTIGTTTTVPYTINSGAWIGSDISTRDFTPTQINQINSTAGITGTPLISTLPQAPGLGTSGLILGLAAAGCAAQWAINEASGATQAATTDKALAVTSGPYVVTFDAANSAKQNNTKFKSIQDCLVKTIAQAAIDQITRSVVAWINSGFNGKPSFVTNFNQYFANVADQAAGAFIKGSALSFLCTPFASQIKIAIAQSYANRGSGASCSLTSITNNINGFVRGNWGAGGWGGLLQMTTVPTNNPYGAYAYGQIGLQAQVASAQNNANRNVSPGGFISIQKCTPSTVGAGPNQNGQAPGVPQNCQTTTPGAIIESSLKTSLGAPIQGLNLAQDINAIITALTNQVMLKTLYGGLANANGITNPLAPAIDQAASAQAQALLAQLQAALNFAGQYANVEQGSINDIEQAQHGLNDAFNCWSTAASSTSLAPDKQAQAGQNAAAVDATLQAYQPQIDALNSDITNANASLAIVQNLQSQVYFAATPDDLGAAQNAIVAASAQGAFFSQTDVTTVQQNRATLQATLAAQGQQTGQSIAQCHAFK